MNNKIIIINGPNLNLLGEREQSQYGSISFDELKNNCIEKSIEITKSSIEKEFSLMTSSITSWKTAYNSTEIHKIIPIPLTINDKPVQVLTNLESDMSWNITQINNQLNEYNVKKSELESNEVMPLHMYIKNVYTQFYNSINFMSSYFHRNKYIEYKPLNITSFNNALKLIVGGVNIDTYLPIGYYNSNSVMDFINIYVYNSFITYNSIYNEIFYLSVFT